MTMIEKGIPIPKTEMLGPTPKWPFGALEIGDSFLAENVKIKSMRRLMTIWSQKTGKRFLSRRISSDSVRIWRIG